MKKIWEWSFRKVFQHTENPDLCIKKLKKERQLKYSFWIRFSISQKIYTILKFGITDFNQYDYRKLKKAKKILPYNTPKYLNITDQGLVQSLIKDYNWNISKNLKKFNTNKLSTEFLNELENIVDKLIAKMA
jgi:hypothetical protein